MLGTVNWMENQSFSSFVGNSEKSLAQRLHCVLRSRSNCKGSPELKRSKSNCKAEYCGHAKHTPQKGPHTSHLCWILEPALQTCHARTWLLAAFRSYATCHDRNTGSSKSFNCSSVMEAVGICTGSRSFSMLTCKTQLVRFHEQSAVKICKDLSGSLRYVWPSWVYRNLLIAGRNPSWLVAYAASCTPAGSRRPQNAGGTQYAYVCLKV